MYGEGVFFEDAINIVYPTAYEAAVEEAGIEPVDRAEVDIVDVSKANGLEFKATVTVKPEVEVKNYKGIAATKKVAKVTDEEIEAELKRYQDRNARQITVEGRAAQLGDTAVIDFEGFCDGVAFEGGKGEQFPLNLGSGQFIPGFEDQVVGKNIGEEFDVDVTFPEDYGAKELAGKKAVFKCKLHELKAKELPELDDELAKDVSEFETLAELKDDIAKKIQAAKDKAANDDVENQLIDKVIEEMTAEIPQCMIEQRIDSMVNDFVTACRCRG